MIWNKTEHQRREILWQLKTLEQNDMLGVDEKHILSAITISHGEHGITLALLKDKSVN